MIELKRDSKIKRILTSFVFTVPVIFYGPTLSATETLRFTSFEPEVIVGHQAKLFADALSKTSNGELDTEFYWSGSLLPAAQMASGIADGVADIGVVLPPYNPSDFPIANWATALGSLVEPEFPRNVLQGAAANAEAILNNTSIAEEFSKQGLVLLTPLFAYPNYELLCTKPVRNIEEAKGKRVRVGGNLWAKEAESVGMVPVALPGSDVYQAVQRGLVDCVMQYPSGFSGQGVWEVASHYTPTQFTGWNAMYLVMSKAKWQKLSELQKSAVMSAAVEYFIGTHETTLREYALFAGPEADKHSIKFYPQDETLQLATQKAQARARDGLIESAPKTLNSPEAFIQSYKEAMDKWKEILFTENLVDFELVDASNPREKLLSAKDVDVSIWAEKVRNEIFNNYKPYEKTAK